MFMQINDAMQSHFHLQKDLVGVLELNLTYIFEKLFEGEPGGGYLKERVIQNNETKNS